MECYIFKPAQSLLMKHLVIGQHQKAANFSAFHWSPRDNLVSIGQHFVITRVVHLPKRTETSLITAGLITESDQAVRAVHSCNSWLLLSFYVSNFSYFEFDSNTLPSNLRLCKILCTKYDYDLFDSNICISLLNVRGLNLFIYIIFVIIEIN